MDRGHKPVHLKPAPSIAGTKHLDEEARLTLSRTTVRMRDAFDREQITKRFYGEFEAQHQAFRGFIKGLEAATDRQWYASLMPNRLMFVYFIQRKGFLANDPNYLRERLKRIRAEQGVGQFHSFYRVFLLTLFHGGLAAPESERDPTTNRLLSNSISTGRTGRLIPA